MILEMEREEELHGKHSRRLAKLKELAALQEKVVNRMLDWRRCRRRSSTGCWTAASKGMIGRRGRI
jgi:hypothetical protein